VDPVVEKIRHDLLPRRPSPTHHEVAGQIMRLGNQCCCRRTKIRGACRAILGPQAGENKLRIKSWREPSAINKPANQDPRRRSRSHRDPPGGGGFTESEAPGARLQNSKKTKRGESIPHRPARLQRRSPRAQSAAGCGGAAARSNAAGR